MKMQSLFHPVCLWPSGIMFVFMGNAQSQSICLKGFHPHHCGSPDAITPEQALRYHRSAQGRYGGQALFSPSSYQHLEFPVKGKGILQSQKIQNPAGSTASQRTFAFRTSSHVGIKRMTAKRAKYGFAKAAVVKIARTMPTRMRYTKRTLTS